MMPKIWRCLNYFVRFFINLMIVVKYSYNITMLKQTSNFITLFVLLSFLLIGGFGLSHSSGMEMRDDGTMGGCMFDGRAEICPMTLAEHISNWQSMFSVIPQKSTVLIQLLVLISTLILAASVLGWRSPPSLFSYFSERWRLYIKNNPNLPLFDRLREAFSQGILNPKIYDFAIL